VAGPRRPPTGFLVDDALGRANLPQPWGQLPAARSGAEGMEALARLRAVPHPSGGLRPEGGGGPGPGSTGREAVWRAPGGPR